MLYVFGNSHVVTFSGSPPCGNLGRKISEGKPQVNPQHPTVCSNFLGRGIIAYNFRTKHLPKVFDLLARLGVSKNTDRVLLYVGEVDCRYHIAKRVLAGGDREALVDELATRFWGAVEDLAAAGWKVVVCGTHPTTTDGHDEHPDHPHWGDCALRNGVCVAWNKALKARCDAAGVPFVSIYDRLVDEGNITKMEYFVDYCHLSYDKCFPFFVEELKRVGAWPG